MGNYTTNLSLYNTDMNTDGNDYFDFQRDLNDNNDKIDSAFGKLSDLNTTYKTNIVGAINESLLNNELYLPENYTINLKADGTGDFPTIKDAINYIGKHIINNKVIIELDDGTYNIDECIFIRLNAQSFNGTTNLSILIKSKNEDNSLVTIKATSTMNYLFYISDMAVDVKDITFDCNSLSGMSFLSFRSIVRFTNCVFKNSLNDAWGVDCESVGYIKNCDTQSNNVGGAYVGGKSICNFQGTNTLSCSNDEALTIIGHSFGILDSGSDFTAIAPSGRYGIYNAENSMLALNASKIRISSNKTALYIDASVAYINCPDYILEGTGTGIGLSLLVGSSFYCGGNANGTIKSATGYAINCVQGSQVALWVGTHKLQTNSGNVCVYCALESIVTLTYANTSFLASSTTSPAVNTSGNSNAIIPRY